MVGYGRVTIANADTAIATEMRRKGSGDGTFGGIDLLEFEERASLGAHDLERLHGTETRSEHSAQISSVNSFNDTL